MHTGHNHDLFIEDFVEKTVGKTRYQSTTRFAMNDGIFFRMPGGVIQNRFNSNEKLLTQTDALSLIPLKCFFKVGSRGGTEYRSLHLARL